jgi:anti-sigma B factor antagonist
MQLPSMPIERLQSWLREFTLGESLTDPTKDCNQMSKTKTAPQNDYFQLTRRGDLVVMIPSPDIENLPANLIEPASQIVLSSLKANPATNMIVDLSRMPSFGSEFISFLLRCHLVVKKQDCELVLAGVNPRMRELLQQTALDTLWALYDDRDQAIEALSGSD